jgi:hypothetical protein
MRKTIFLLLLIAALGLTACERSLSDSPTALPGEGTPTEAYPAPVEDDGGAGDVGTGIEAGEFATQTAQAEVNGVEKDPDSGGEATDGSNNGEVEATAPAPEPTAAPAQDPEPTDAPEPENNNSNATDCSSPYTVKTGDWVWDIGRRCDIHPQDIISANNLFCYYDFAGRLQCPVQAGDKLILPGNARAFP